MDRIERGAGLVGFTAVCVGIAVIGGGFAAIQLTTEAIKRALRH